MPYPFVHPTAQIDPGAIIREDTIIGPHAHIGPEVCFGVHVQVGSHTSITGLVNISHRTRIGRAVILFGPLQVWNDVVIEDGVSIGVWFSDTSSLKQGVINQGAHIEASAIVLGGLSIGDYARLWREARLEGDLPTHAAAAGQPAALVDFVCECGKLFQYKTGPGELVLCKCPSCWMEYRLARSIFERRGKYLKPNQQAGDPVPSWWRATLGI